MSSTTQSEEEQLHELGERLKHLQAELRYTREETRRVEDLAYEKAKNLTNSKTRLIDEMNRGRAIAKARGDGQTWGFASPSSQMPWEIARDLRVEAQEQARDLYLKQSRDLRQQKARADSEYPSTYDSGYDDPGYENHERESYPQYDSDTESDSDSEFRKSSFVFDKNPRLGKYENSKQTM